MMVRILLTVLFLLALLGSQAQTVSGVILSKIEKRPISYASIYAVKQKMGIASDHQGKFIIDLKLPEKLIISAIGFQTDTVTVTQSNSLTITLEEQAVQLQEVQISADYNPAIPIIKGVIASEQNSELSSYSAISYIRASLDEEYKNTLKNSRNQINLVESQSEVTFTKSGVQETVNAYRDLATKSFNQINQALLNGNPYQTSKWTPVNPDLYHIHHDESQFNLYNKILNLPGLTTSPILSPLGENGLNAYHFILKDSVFWMNPNEVQVSFHPKTLNNNGVTGKVIIDTVKNQIIHSEISIPPKALFYHSMVRITQDYQSITSQISLINHQEINYTIESNSKTKYGKTQIFLSDFAINGETDIHSSQLIIPKKAMNTDESTWNSLRPASLNSSEKTRIQEAIILEEIKSKEAYQDSVLSSLSKLSFNNIFYNGIVKSDSNQINTFSIRPVLRSIRPLHISGFRYSLGMSWTHELKTEQSIEQTGELSFGVKNLDLKGQYQIQYTYAPLKFGAIRIGAGNVFSQLTSLQSFSHIISGSNYLEREFLRIANNVELFNGGLLEFGAEYARLQDIDQYQTSDWRDRVFPENNPTLFSNINSLVFNGQFTLRFKQNYLIRGNNKIITNYQYPEVIFSYKKGIKTSNTQADFDYLEVKVQDDKTWKRIGTSKLRIRAGDFLTQKRVPIDQLRYFRGSDNWFLSDPLNTFQLFERGTYATQKAFIEAHYIQHFNGFFLQKLPLLDKTKLTVIGGGSAFQQENRKLHIESFWGIERTLRIDNQQYRVSLTYHHPIASQQLTEPRFKIGIDLFNFMTKEWIY